MPHPSEDIGDTDGPQIEIWKLLKRKVIEKLRRLNRLVREGECVGQEVELPPGIEGGRRACDMQFYHTCRPTQDDWGLGLAEIGLVDDNRS